MSASQQIVPRTRRWVRLFKPQFAAMVSDGRKCQTVRPVPKRMPQAGDSISLCCWEGKPYRSKQRLLTEATITRVSKITITEMGYEHWDEGWRVMMSPESLDDFARRDGFQDWSALTDWFRETYALPFYGVCIHWENLKVSDRP